MKKSESLKLLLKKLQSAMVSAGLWQRGKPSNEALSSRQPFCCDTLRFEQWLQFIFIPRIELMIGQGQALPTNFVITPMAHQSWDLSNEEVQVVTKVLMDIDTLMSGDV